MIQSDMESLMDTKRTRLPAIRAQILAWWSIGIHFVKVVLGLYDAAFVHLVLQFIN